MSWVFFQSGPEFYRRSLLPRCPRKEAVNQRQEITPLLSWQMSQGREVTFSHCLRTNITLKCVSWINTFSQKNLYWILIVCQATTGWVLETQQWTGQNISHGADFPCHSLHTCMTIPSSLHSGWNLRLVWGFDLGLEEKNVKHMQRSPGWMLWLWPSCSSACCPQGSRGQETRKERLTWGFLRPSWRDVSVAKNACCSCWRWTFGS